MTTAYTEALERALGRVIADAERQLEVYREKADALIAGLSARLVETEVRCAALESEVRRSVEERLAAVKDGAPGKDADPAVTAALVAEALEARLAAVEARDVAAELRPSIEAIGRALDELEIPEAPELPDVAGMVQEAVSAAVAGIEPPPDVAPLVEAAVRAAVDALPGQDEVERLIAEHVERAVSALPPAAPGKDADPEEMRAAVAEAVTAAVAALPPAEPGKDADEDAIVARVLAAMPTKDELRGPPGRLPVAKAWIDDVHREGDVVRHGGALWQAQRDTGKEPPHEDWACLAAPGDKGDPGESMTVRGTWSAEEAYRRLDVVALDGSGFVAKMDDPGPCPGDGWQLVASKGGRGKPGEPGKGIPGRPGAPVIEGTVTEDGMLRLTNGDGSVAEVDFYPVLSRLK
ncbi:hypothetical protein [uncultured Amaricoccus sp.]|uniref:hypothetical protein n=1 Tax=uncultured Amaricoccus sp. TaxID=339341 RepID=UPI002610F83F|nr:hypothetical protein [uncultured Amaricoccus sp.]